MVRGGPPVMQAAMSRIFGTMNRFLLPILLLVAVSGCKRDDATPRGEGGPRSSHIELAVDSACVQAPNVFTPNGDGVNDVFYVLARHIASIYITVLNMAGDTVHVSDDLHSNQWDGTDTTGHGPYMVHVEAISLSGHLLQGESPLHRLDYGTATCLAYHGTPVGGDQFDPRICGVAYPTHEIFCP